MDTGQPIHYAGLGARRKLDSTSPEQLVQWAGCVLEAVSIRDILSE